MYFAEHSMDTGSRIPVWNSHTRHIAVRLSLRSRAGNNVSTTPHRSNLRIRETLHNF